MSYNEGIAIGNALASIGGSLDDLYRKQNAESRDRQINTYAYDVYKNGEGALENVPPEMKLKVMWEAANFIAKEQSNSDAARRGRVEQFIEDRQNLRTHLQAAEQLYKNKQYNEAAAALAKAYPYAPDGNSARAVNATGERSPEGEGIGSYVEGIADYEIVNQFTGAKSQFEATPENIKQGIEYLTPYTQDPEKDFHGRLQQTLAKQKWNHQDAWQNREDIYDKDGNYVATRFDMFQKTGPYTFTEDRKPVYIHKDTAQPVDPASIDGQKLTSVRAEEAKATMAESQLKKIKAGIGAQTVNSPDPKTAYVANDNRTYMRTLGGGAYQPVNEDMAPKEERRYSLVQTDDGDTMWASPPTLKEGARKVQTGIRKKAKEKGIEVRTADGKVVSMTEPQAWKRLNNLKNMLKDAKTSDGNQLIIPDLSMAGSMTEDKKISVLGNLQQISRDTVDRTAKERAVATEALRLLQALLGPAGSTPGKGIKGLAGSAPGKGVRGPAQRGGWKQFQPIQ